MNAKNEKLKERKRQAYQEKKEEIKAKKKARDAKQSKELLLFTKEQNEKEIDELSDKGENLNILYKDTNNLEEILKESTVICHYCKDIYDPSSILKHIGNNRECKSFYEPNFENANLLNIINS